MMSFRNERLKNFAIPAGSVWLMTDIAQSKGRQDLYTKQSPQILKALRDMALVQSVESSNRIEGITVQAQRLKPLVLGNVRPKNRSEEEVQGYRKALNLIHANHKNLAITPELMKKLHLMIQEGSGDAGQFKNIDNEIIETKPGQAPFIRFKPVSFKDTPKAAEELCVAYRHAINQEHVPPILAIAAFVLDFLCIHPFRDGNGRVARLLTLLALYQRGIDVGRYISIERLVEDTREDYYRVLLESSRKWHEGRHNIIPWFNYFLSIIRRAYIEFEDRAGKVKSAKGAKTGFVLNAIKSFAGNFTLADLEKACPGVSRDMIRLVLKDLSRKGVVKCLGKGPGALWSKRG
ncbi:MAG: Fic family protein [Elusimicrobia bacterium]|nr:Fic family protein [Elusimicrobiota bacterium]